ncbi:uncharacterized protein LOC135396665 [Ornithodoros turicata]|uniref:uncharacterized protein LOC135396665 n=1 Tax=Ornithodoros turicata TaxID=34597 RepID=UPI0031391E26
MATNSAHIAYRCNKCQSTFSQLHPLRQHHVDVHNFQVNYETHEFNSEADFHAWKEEMQKATRSHFIKRTGKKRLKDGGSKCYYICNRSGAFIEKTQHRKRSIKSQGSVKCGSTCLADMSAIFQNGKVSVVFQASHYGHDFELCHTLLTKTGKDAIIAGKLHDDVAPSVAFDGIRGMLDDTFQTIHLTARQALHNIMTDYNICYDERKHEDDHHSVALWVSSMRSQTNNPVLFFKQQGEKDDPTVFQRGNTDLLQDEDFLLVLMTGVQKQMSRHLGTEKVCVDSTHGTTGFNFQLVALLCVDEFGAGVPLAYCISNRTDCVALKLFYKCIKEETGPLHTKVFMSDSVPAFYKAWEETMGPVQKRLLCEWHIDRCWRKNIAKYISCKEHQAHVYKVLRTLLSETDVDVFKKLHDAFLNDCKGEHVQDFRKYFEKMYAGRPEIWAYCYRTGTGLNENMHLEVFHRVLKCCYLDGKKNKRVDKLISTLLRLTRDKTFEHVVQLAMEKPCSYLAAINSRHKRGEQIKPDDVHQADIGQWKVKSQSFPDTHYVVTKMTADICNTSCRIICRPCSACIHAYRCSCPDNLVHMNMCKHIHSVALWDTATPPSSARPDDDDDDTDIQWHPQEDTEVCSPSALMRCQGQAEESATLDECKILVEAVSNRLSSPLCVKTRQDVARMLREVLSVMSADENDAEPAATPPIKTMSKHVQTVPIVKICAATSKPTFAEMQMITRTFLEPDVPTTSEDSEDHTYVQK